MSPDTGIILCSEDVEGLRALLDSSASRRGSRELEDLEAELDRARVVSRVDVPAGVVTMGATVEFENEGTHRRQLVQLVYPAQANLAQGRISVVAPLGAALLGLRVGQSLDWTVPSGKVRVRILRVIQPLQRAPPRLASPAAPGSAGTPPRSAQ